MSDHQEKRDKIQELADEFRLKAHLAGMDAKTLWEEEVEPLVKKLDKQFDEATKDMKLPEELNDLEKKLRKLVDDVID